MTHAQELWGRKFQASLAYTYFSSGHQGVDVGYGVWDWIWGVWLDMGYEVMGLDVGLWGWVWCYGVGYGVIGLDMGL